MTGLVCITAATCFIHKVDLNSLKLRVYGGGREKGFIWSRESITSTCSCVLLCVCVCVCVGRGRWVCVCGVCVCVCVWRLRCVCVCVLQPSLRLVPAPSCSQGSSSGSTLRVCVLQSVCSPTERWFYPGSLRV